MYKLNIDKSFIKVTKAIQSRAVSDFLVFSLFDYFFGLYIYFREPLHP